MTDHERRAEQAKKRLGRELLGRDGLVGIGVGESEAGRLELVVHLESDDCPAAAHVPAEWEGFTVRKIATGRPEKRE